MAVVQVHAWVSLTGHAGTATNVLGMKPPVQKGVSGGALRAPSFFVEHSGEHCLTLGSFLPHNGAISCSNILPLLCRDAGGGRDLGWFPLNHPFNLMSE